MSNHHRSAIVAVVAVTSSFARGEPPTKDDPHLADLATMPPPGEESGRADATRDEDSISRKVVRGALFVPRIALEVAVAPVRGGIWAYERYQLKERYFDLFFNDARTMGLYPTVALRSGYGFTVGAKFVHEDLFGERERVKAAVATGGRYSELATLGVSTGRRLGRVELELDAGAERRTKDAYYGIGNLDDMPEARYRLQVLRVKAGTDARIARSFYARATTTIARFDVSSSDSGPAIFELYPDAMLGLAGTRHAYGELELRWDSRGRGDPWDHPASYGQGWLLAAYGGRVEPLDDAASYSRYGVDLQRYLRLGAGPRVLAVRLFAEGISRSSSEVPFTQLPRLGGKELMRGYPLDRFRDRVVALGSLEYSWDVSRHITTSAFVDAGRVAPAFDELSWSGMRVGYGLGLELFSKHSFLLRASLATSIDGGVFFDVAFDPSFEPRSRTEPP